MKRTVHSPPRHFSPVRKILSRLEPCGESAADPTQAQSWVHRWRRRCVPPRHFWPFWCGTALDQGSGLGRARVMPHLPVRKKCLARDREEQLICRNAQRFRGGLVLKAHTPWYYSTLDLGVKTKKKEIVHPIRNRWRVGPTMTLARARIIVPNRLARRNVLHLDINAGQVYRLWTCFFLCVNRL